MRPFIACSLFLALVVSYRVGAFQEKTQVIKPAPALNLTSYFTDPTPTLTDHDLSDQTAAVQLRSGIPHLLSPGGLRVDDMMGE